MTWPQIDYLGHPLPSVTYTVEINVGGTQYATPVTIGGADAAIAMLGVPKVGNETGILMFCAPLDPGILLRRRRGVQLAVGIPTCAGNVPLALDPLFFYSIDPTNLVFLDFVGALDPSGMSSVPSLSLRTSRQLIGASVSSSPSP